MSGTWTLLREVVCQIAGPAVCRDMEYAFARYLNQANFGMIFASPSLPRCRASLA